MSTRTSVLVLCALLLAPAIRAEDVKAARRIVDRAIAASGGAKLLISRQALSGVSRGTITLNGDQHDVENTWTVEGLDRLKWASDLTKGDKTLTILLVLDGKRGWLRGNGQKSTVVPDEVRTPLRQGFAGLRLVETLIPLLDGNTKLSPLGELKVDGRPTVGVKVTRKGLPDIDLYFDKETNLPARAEMRLTEPNKVEATYAATFADYEKVAGRTVFTRLTLKRDDEVVLSMKRSGIEAKEKADDGTFAQP